MNDDLSGLDSGLNSPPPVFELPPSYHNDPPPVFEFPPSSPQPIDPNDPPPVFPPSSPQPLDSGPPFILGPGWGDIPKNTTLDTPSVIYSQSLPPRSDGEKQYSDLKNLFIEFMRRVALTQKAMGNQLAIQQRELHQLQTKIRILQERPSDQKQEPLRRSERFQSDSERFQSDSPVKCEHCERPFTTKKQLRRHNKNRTISRSTTFKLNGCLKSPAVRDQLINRLKTCTHWSDREVRDFQKLLTNEQVTSSRTSHYRILLLLYLS